jgi:hypothetical protein
VDRWRPGDHEPETLVQPLSGDPCHPPRRWRSTSLGTSRKHVTSKGRGEGWHAGGLLARSTSASGRSPRPASPRLDLLTRDPARDPMLHGSPGC